MARWGDQNNPDSIVAEREVEEREIEKVRDRKRARKRQRGDRETREKAIGRKETEEVREKIQREGDMEEDCNEERR